MSLKTRFLLNALPIALFFAREVEEWLEHRLIKAERDQDAEIC